MSEPIPVTEACDKYGLELKRLAGRVLRNSLHDPIGGYRDDGVACVYDDWRLQQMAADPQAGEIAVEARTAD